MATLKWKGQSGNKADWMANGRYGVWHIVLTLVRTETGVQFELQRTKINDESFEYDTIHEEHLEGWTISPFSKRDAMEMAKKLVLTPNEYFVSEVDRANRASRV